MIIGATGSFTNEGIFNSQATGSGVAELDAPFVNTGTVNVLSNLLTISSSGTDTGDYVVTAGATLEFDGGTRNFNTGVDFTELGAGSVDFAGATVNFNSGSTYDITNTFIGSAVTFDTGVGTVTFPNLTVSGGTLQGTDNFVVSNSATFNGFGTT